MSSLANFTAMQQVFIRMVVEGCNLTAAAERAGYAEPGVACHSLMRLPHVRQEIQERRERAFAGDLGTLCMATLEWCLRHGKPEVRLKAALYGLDVAGIKGQTKFSTQNGMKKGLVEMSEQELIEFVRSKEKELVVLEAVEVKTVVPQSEIDDILS